VNKTKFAWAGVLACGLAAIAVPATAGVINYNILNPSFEAPIVSPATTVSGGYYTTAADPVPIAGWNIGSTTGNIGVWNPSKYAPSYVAPDGNQVAYTGYGYGIIYQDVGAVIGGFTYTLSVDVGDRIGIAPGQYRVMLGIGGHDLATTSVFASSGYDPVALTPGAFSDVMLTGVAPNGSTGDVMVFLEGGQDAFGFNGQTGWDSVKLTAVPEPITLSLFGVGLAGAFVGRRRKSKQT
jgi:hypothetical protein